MSLPVRERGLKLEQAKTYRIKTIVAPCAGAWIETVIFTNVGPRNPVAPCVGAWIETRWTGMGTIILWVAPRVGAWIETQVQVYIEQTTKSRLHIPR